MVYEQDRCFTARGSSVYRDLFVTRFCKRSSWRVSITGRIGFRQQVWGAAGFEYLGSGVSGDHGRW